MPHAHTTSPPSHAAHPTAPQPAAESHPGTGPDSPHPRLPASFPKKVSLVRCQLSETQGARSVHRVANLLTSSSLPAPRSSLLPASPPATDSAHSPPPKPPPHTSAQTRAGS